MIPQISEVNFPSYATLHQATASFEDMGDRTISTQVRIDGDIVPDFDGWELTFDGERFILPVKEPQAAKDNSSRNSLVDLVFHSWVIWQLKRYFFVETATVGTNTVIADKYTTGFSLPIKGFVDLFNNVLSFYFGTEVEMDLYQYSTYDYPTDTKSIEINNTTIWEVLTKMYELYGYRWNIIYDSVNSKYVIKVNYPSDTISNHDFEYGYQGGLQRFERQVQDYDVKNILIGRGGEKNLPYRYFKKQDPNNDSWAADPDAIPELANIYFDRLRDYAFRWYIRGWVKNEHRDTSGDTGYTLPDYDDEDVPEAYKWAYDKGRYEDETFSPVEYVKDDDSIEKYGERWGALADDNETFPTIQGVEIDGLGRVDETVAISEIQSDDIPEASEENLVEFDIEGVTAVAQDVTPSLTPQTFTVRGGTFTVEQGRTAIFSRNGAWIGKITYAYGDWPLPIVGWPYPGWKKVGENDALQSLVTLNSDNCSIKVYDATTDQEVQATGLTGGTYYYEVTIQMSFPTPSSSVSKIYYQYGVNGMRLVYTDVAEPWKPTFDIWIKNIWQSTQGGGESDVAYATRVWQPILGDRAGNEAKVVFSSGFMSTSEDYEFVIVSYPVPDRTKTITVGGNTYQSEWKITLQKCDAEYEATGKYIPNAETGGQPQAGDKFFFTGIDMPHAYVEWAEAALTEKKSDSLEETADVKPTWVVTLDKVRINTLESGESQYLIDRLKTGTIIKIRDKRFTANEEVPLFIKSISYTWSEPTAEEPALVPEIEIVLSDVLTTPKSTISVIQGDIKEIRSSYARTSDVEAIIREVGNSLFLKKTGEPDKSESPTRFGNLVTSKDFVQGDMTGAGWGLYKDPDGTSVFEIDRIIARRELHVNDLVAHNVTYVGGKQIRSAAAIECTEVYEDANGYVCKFDQKQGSVNNFFVVDDIAYCQFFDMENNETKSYRRLVVAVAQDSITLSKTVKSGDGIPTAGDTIIQFGNTTDANRQFVIISDVIGGGYEQMVSGLNSVSAAGSTYYYAGAKVSGNTKSERWFVGDANGEHAVWENGSLTVKGVIYAKRGNNQYTSLDYLLNALPDGDVVTTITGGVVLSTIIGVQSGNNLVAGLNASSSLASDQTHGTVMIFAGATNAQSVGSAKFRVYGDGRMVATDADITGKITASSGQFGELNDGGFEISSYGIKSVMSSGVTGEAYNTLKLQGAYMEFLMKDGDTIPNSTVYNHVLVGGDLGSAIAGTLSSVVVSMKRNGDALFPGLLTNEGISIDITGDYVNNVAINCVHGVFKGLRPYTRILTTTPTTLTPSDFVVEIGAAMNITLPSSPQIGQTYFLFYPKAVGQVRIYPATGNSIYWIGHGTYTTSSPVTKNNFTGMAMCIFNGTWWTFIDIDNA